MSYEPGQVVGEIETSKGKLILSIVSDEDAEETMNLINSMVEKDYIYTKPVPNIENAIKRIKKMIDRAKKGSIELSGRINGILVLNAGLTKQIIKSGEHKGKYCGEVGILIRDGYRHIGIGGKLMDFFVEKAREMGLVYVWGQFFSENFDSLVLCKSRKLKVYRVDKNKDPKMKEWQKKYHKWGKDFDRYNARIFIEQEIK